MTSLESVLEEAPARPSAAHGAEHAVSWAIGRSAALVLLLAALALVWWSPFDHPLYPSDESRYGTVAATMAESGDWLVPHFRGAAHLTKPPLTYWLQALGIASWGRTEAAVRLPSFVATSAVIALIFAFGAARLGRNVGVCAALIYAIMPEALVVGRVGATDAILNLWWIIALIAGHEAICGRRWSWALAFWSALALAALTKGPVALMPLVIVVAWRVLAGDVRSLRALRPMVGIPIALAPIAAWAALAAHREPELWHVWWSESVGRASGDLGKRDVWWFYLPVFLLGMFPASAMLTLPGFNLTWRTAWARLRDGSLESLLVIAVIVPMIGFSLSSGKLPTYLLPVAAPLALLVGAMIARRWLESSPRADERPPDVRITVLVSCVVAAIALPIAAARFDVPTELRWESALLALPALGVGYLALRWRDERTRRHAFVVAWAGFAAAWLVAFRVEDALLKLESPRTLTAQLASIASDAGEVFTVGRTDPAREFYRFGRVRDLGHAAPPWIIFDAMRHARAGVFDNDEWEELCREVPDIAAQLEPVARGSAFFHEPYVVCRVLSKERRGLLKKMW